MHSFRLYTLDEDENDVFIETFKVEVGITKGPWDTEDRVGFKNRWAYQRKFRTSHAPRVL